MDGIITFGSPAENQISVTFDDWKTGAEKIVKALGEGGVSVRENPAPVP